MLSDRNLLFPAHHSHQLMQIHMREQENYTENFKENVRQPNQ